MPSFVVRHGLEPADEYGDRMTVAGDVELDRVRSVHQLRAYRIASVLRIGVVGLMVAAMVVGTPKSERAQQTTLVVVYAFVALGAAVLAFARPGLRVGVGRSADIGRWSSSRHHRRRRRVDGLSAAVRLRDPSPC